jgi:hypothetical protein
VYVGNTAPRTARARLRLGGVRVEQHDVGLERSDRVDHGRDVDALPNDSTAAGTSARTPGADHDVVVDEEDAGPLVHASPVSGTAQLHLRPLRGPTGRRGSFVLA